MHYTYGTILNRLVGFSGQKNIQSKHKNRRINIFRPSSLGDQLERKLLAATFYYTGGGPAGAEVYDFPGFAQPGMESGVTGQAGAGTSASAEGSDNNGNSATESAIVTSTVQGPVTTGGSTAGTIGIAGTIQSTDTLSVTNGPVTPTGTSTSLLSDSSPYDYTLQNSDNSPISGDVVFTFSTSLSDVVSNGANYTDQLRFGFVSSLVDVAGGLNAPGLTNGFTFTTPGGTVLATAPVQGSNTTTLNFAIPANTTAMSIMYNYQATFITNLTGQYGSGTTASHVGSFGFNATFTYS